MCIRPSVLILKSGFRQEVACRNCYQCRANRVQDWVGRTLAEHETCSSASFATLTYGKSDHYGEKVEDLAAKVLLYRDVQLFLKQVRFAGFKVRYLVAGEYGTEKGRAHWHALLFWEGKAWEPKTDALGREWENPFWPHGFVHWDEFNYKSASYVLKYLLKDEASETNQNLVRMSKRPLLGFYYFRKRAEQVARERLPLNDGLYEFPDVREYKSGKPRQFMLQGVSSDLYIEGYVNAYRRMHGANPPLSEYLERYYDRKALPSVEWKPDKRGAYRRAPHIPVPIFENGHPVKPQFDEKRNTWFYADLDGVVLWWSFDNKGERAWRSVIVTETEAKAIREGYAKQNSSGAYREASGRSIDKVP